MTREEAIEKLELMRQKVDEETYRALILAIKALEQEPTFDDECQKDMNEAWEQIQKKRKRIPVTLDLTPCDDAISRQAVIEKLNELDWQELYLPIHFKKHIIDKLPSVTQKSGKWIDKEISNPDYPFQDRKIIECSKCHYGIVQARLGYTNYCPNCGAKMESEE